MPHPKIFQSSQPRQSEKNQMLHGMTKPSSVGFGPETVVVTGVIYPPTTPDSVDNGGLVMDGLASEVLSFVT